MSTNVYNELFNGILLFRVTKPTSEGRFDYAQSILGEIYQSFGGLDPLATAMALEPGTKGEKIRKEFCALLGSALHYESDLFASTLSWAYADATCESPKIMNQQGCRLLVERFERSAPPKYGFMRPKVFSPQGEPRFSLPEYFHFFSGDAIDTMKQSFDAGVDPFLAQIAHTRNAMTDIQYTVVKDAFQRRAFEAHLEFDDPRWAFMFEGEQPGAVLSERIAEVIQDINSPIIIEYVHKIVDSLARHIGYLDLPRQEVEAAISNHIDWTYNVDLAFNLDFGVHPIAYFIHRLSREGVIFNRILKKCLNLPSDCDENSLLQAAVLALPPIPKTQLLKKQEVWLGAFLEAYPTEKIMELDLGAQDWQRLYLFKGDDRLRSRIKDERYMDEVLAYDLGL